ncbi:MAG: protease inhibitor I42 family protein [Candidatus Omnitrophica bacterium]|nr:protease inhibitor I42 family protein [Candidatus Omnitrophota bacterium]
MKAKLTMLFLFALSVLICVSAHAENNPKTEPELYTRIEINAGEDVIITLDANPTTGYTWEIAKPLDKIILGKISSSYVPEETGRVGSGGKEIWVIKTLKPGKTKAIFHYLRSWEKNVPPVKTETFLIIVK